MPLRKGLSAPQNTFLDTIAQRFDGTHSNFVLGNANACNCPIVYVSDGFCELSHCTRAFVMSKSCNCAFLYGDQTSENGKRRLEQALKNKSEVKLEIVLYKKTGHSFWCLLDVIPIKNERGEVALFLVSFKDITKERLNATPYCGILMRPGESKKDRHRVTFALKTMASAAQTLATVTTQQSSNADGSAHNRGDTLLSANASLGVGVGVDDSDDEALAMISKRKNYGRRRSRAVLYHLSGHFQRKTKPKLQLQNLPGKDSLPEYKVQNVKTSRFILRHYGLVRFCWDWLILLCTFYIAIMVPYHAAFLNFEEDKKFKITDVAVEVFFMIDIILNFRTTFVNQSGQVVYDAKSIAWNYARTWFLLDFCAAMPFDFLEALTVEIGIKVHLLKLTRLLRLARLLQKLDRYAQYSFIVLMLLTSMFALVAHWLACIWYTIGREEFEKNDANWTVGWLPELAARLNIPFDGNKTRGYSGPSTLACYISALYFTCSSLTSVGFGNVSANTVAEKIFSVCAMLAGALMHAVVFGNVTAIIQRMYSRRAAYQTKSNDLKDFIKAHHLPKHIKQRMNEFFQTTWSINHGICVDDIMKDFPEELRGDIAMHLYRDALAIPVFSKAPLGCMKRLAYQGIRYRFCTPGEFLIHSGDHIASLCFICAGSIEILKDGLVVAILGKGDLFGVDFRQLARLNTSAASGTLPKATNVFPKLESVVKQQIQSFKSKCDVRALTYCDLQLIDIEKLYFLLLSYEEYSSQFYRELGNELTYNLTGDEEAEDAQVEECEEADELASLDNLLEPRKANGSHGAVKIESDRNMRKRSPPPAFDTASDDQIEEESCSNDKQSDSGNSTIHSDAFTKRLSRQFCKEKKALDGLWREVCEMRNTVNLLHVQLTRLLTSVSLPENLCELDLPDAVQNGCQQFADASSPTLSESVLLFSEPTLESIASSCRRDSQSIVSNNSAHGY